MGERQAHSGRPVRRRRDGANGAAANAAGAVRMGSVRKGRPPFVELVARGRILVWAAGQLHPTEHVMRGAARNLERARQVANCPAVLSVRCRSPYESPKPFRCGVIVVTRGPATAVRVGQPCQAVTRKGGTPLAGRGLGDLQAGGDFLAGLPLGRGQRDARTCG